MPRGKRGHRDLPDMTISVGEWQAIRDREQARREAELVVDTAVFVAPLLPQAGPLPPATTRATVASARGPGAGNVERNCAGTRPAFPAPATTRPLAWPTPASLAGAGTSGPGDHHGQEARPVWTLS
jgi:hypothetical protein